jgi:hypothetical protein
MFFAAIRIFVSAIGSTASTPSAAGCLPVRMPGRGSGVRQLQIHNNVMSEAPPPAPPAVGD